MRADRLLSILLLLQGRGRMTARALAETLEVSERTIYRDMEALTTAGIPIYGEPGPEGGYALLDPYKTDLTGLSEGETRALFMLNTSTPLDALGMGAPLKAAMIKLAAAVSGRHREDEVRVRQRFYLDSVWWHQSGEGSPVLQLLERAVWQDKMVALRFRYGPLGAEVQVEAGPYALVAKGGVWHLIYGPAGPSPGHSPSTPRVTRVSDLVGARVLEAGFERPDDFDLPSFWQAWCAEYEAGHALFLVTARLSPALANVLETSLRDFLHGDPSAPDGRGWVTATLAFGSLETARSRLLAYGGAVEVLAPRALRLSIEDYARQILAAYAHERTEL